MAIATQFTDTISTPISSAGFVTKLDTLLKTYTGESDGTCKYTSYDNYNNTDYYCNQNITNVYQVNFNLNDPSQPYYMRLTVSPSSNNIGISWEWFSSWDKNNHNGQGSSSAVTLPNFLPNQEIDFYNYYSKEMNFLYLQQGSTIGLIGWMKPQFPRSWVNTLVGFPSDYNATTYRTVSPNPYGNYSNNFSTNLGNNSMSDSNPSNKNIRDALSGIIWFDQNRKGTPGKTSDDIISGCFNGLSYFSTDTDPVTGYRYVCLNPVAGGLGVRIA